MAGKRPDPLDIEMHSRLWTVRGIAYGLCLCGCGNPTSLAPQTARGRDLIKGEPRPCLFGHRRLATPDEAERRFWRKVQKTDECWLWQGTRDRRGYGQLRVNKKSRPAHRISYELLVGPIPVGLVIDHLCRNPSCVNPAHLEAVTDRVNILRGSCLSAQRARQSYCKRGHPLVLTNVYRDKKGRRFCRTCKAERMKKVGERRKRERQERRLAS